LRTESSEKQKETTALLLIIHPKSQLIGDEIVSQIPQSGSGAFECRVRIDWHEIVQDGV
jgi:hypothetical protein